MKTKISKYTLSIYIQNILLFVYFITTTTGCNNDDKINEELLDFANVALMIKASSTSVNEDTQHWEDRVDELRMIVFKTETGEVAFNEKLYFPNGFSGKSKAVRLHPGNYDFYFIANETVHTGNFIQALLNIKNKSDFKTDPNFNSLTYNPDFIPDETSENGRFLMSSIYENITITPGGTEENPISLPISTSKIELIRALAKIEVVFRKKTPGSTIPQEAINTVQLNNVASTYSIPPYDNYYDREVSISNKAELSNLDFSNDSLGAVTFYVPEFLIPEGSSNGTTLAINNILFPIQTDSEKHGVKEQRRTLPDNLSNNSVIRNYHYIVNAYVKADEGNEIEIRVYVQPWKKEEYLYVFGGGEHVVIPPVIPTDSSIVIPTDCGKIEILSYNENLNNGLQGAYNDVINWWNAEIGGPEIIKGSSPYYCEKKYGEGWRLINSCELMSFLSVLDATYNVWMSNTWYANTYNNNNKNKPIPFYPLPLRKAAQSLLEKLTGVDLSSSVLMEQNNWADQMADTKLNIIDKYFTPGDILARELDYPGGWPYPSPPATGSSESWYYNEVVIQVKAFWYGSGYVNLDDRANWEKVLYGNFIRYDYSSTVSRCVRIVE